MRLLIVDDNESVRRGIRTLLEAEQSWSVCGEAVDGADAIEKVAQLRPDVVLMDISMPRMDGLEATRVIRRESPETQVIVVTQNDPGVARRQAAEVDARGFVTKTNLAEDLIRQLEAIAEQRGKNLQNSHAAAPLTGAGDLFGHGTHMGELMRSKDWSRTPVGDPENWSRSLRMMVRFLLSNRFPQLLWWGPQFCCLYNDAYIPILGAKHPWALGQPTAEVWSEIWDVLKPLIETPFHGGPPTWIEDIPLEINRRGFVEETHFTVAYSSVPDETLPGEIGGVLATVHEITEKVIGERRGAVLRDLGARSADPGTAEEACKIAAQTLERHAKDIPFALLYLVDDNRSNAYLAAGSGISANGNSRLRQVSLEAGSASAIWPFSEVFDREELTIVRDLPAELSACVAVPGSNGRQASSAVVLPIRSNVQHQLAGFLVVGLNPYIQLDQAYHNFLDLVSAQISITIANARAHAQERKRAEALAEIDRAKTVFFSNVSHEFRTPLTLILGPLQDLLSQSQLTPAVKDQLELMHRNGARLQRLVNTLLDFSRVEAGRVSAVFQPTDLAVFTRDLASIFRSAIERAGLSLRVNCQSTEKLACVDRDMWEKIVLNLISNALKFTFEGEIEVSLKPAGGQIELSVRDTGVGIAPAEIPRLFDRFHRVPNVRSRTHEGSGIGLALVNELVKIHGGSMRVESAPEKGSTFFVTIPPVPKRLASTEVDAALPLASSTAGANSFVEEALRWLPEEAKSESGAVALDSGLLDSQQGSSSAAAGGIRPRVLVADDNSDMRQYLGRLLAEHYEIVTVADGHSALATVKERAPDLVLTDAMMPNLDGFALLRELRSNPATSTIPVIVLSARAGEESRIEGLGAGADDYLVKPFSARELLSRVQTHLTLARVRNEANKQAQMTLEMRVKERTEELERAQTNLRSLSGKLLQLQDEERRRIARELHDSAGQTLTVLGINLAQIANLAKAANDSKISSKAGEMQESVRRLSQEIRTTSYLLHPPLLDESGIGAALRGYLEGLAARSDLKIDLQIPDEFGRLSRELELAIFRIVQECLTNIVRHSRSPRAEIQISREPRQVELRVQDYGGGIGKDRLAAIREGASGVGMRGMHERARQLGGRMEIESGPSGTTIRCHFPVAAVANPTESPIPKRAPAARAPRRASASS